MAVKAETYVCLFIYHYRLVLLIFYWQLSASSAFFHHSESRFAITN